VRRELASGTVTFLFTDVEGSTRLLRELGSEEYARALAEHRDAIRAACAEQGGVEVDTQGDAFFFAFPAAESALAAAAAFTETLASGEIRVRVGLHTGAAHVSDEGYVGEDVHRAARIAACGHGGQVVVSGTTAALLEPAGSALRSLGAHRLKDFEGPATLYQLGEGSFPPLRTIANTNLPTPASSFLGREKELYHADLLLKDTRLLSITGPGGAGKTRFALELARRAREERFSDYEDGVFACFLAPLRDPSLVPPTICQTLSVREQPGLSALESLAARLEGKRMLLLLDNLEHLLDCAPELSQLLAACPGLTLLVTSREVLRLQGERVYALPPLEEEEGVALFCERAQAEPSPPIRELCQRLEGLPLAIELAAARMALLTPEQLLERLSKRLDLLKGTRDADPRQQTLRATIEWSYDLLGPAEQQLVARLSVFAGGCTLEAAEDVCGTDLDTLGSLLDKSLLRSLDAEIGPRFWMLETIRDFARERLAESGEAKDVSQRHADWVLRLTRDAKRKVDREELPRWHTTLEPEQENLRAAFAWMEEASWIDAQLELVWSICHFWYTRGNWREGRRWAEAALSRSEGQRNAIRAKALNAAAGFTERLGDFQFTRLYAEESLSISRETGDLQDSAMALILLGNAAYGDGDHVQAGALYEEAAGEARGSGDRWSLGIALGDLGTVAWEQGDQTRAITLCEEALALLRELGADSLIAWSLSSMADFLFESGRVTEALEAARESLALAHATGDVTTRIESLSTLARIAMRRGDMVSAAALLGAAEAFREPTGMVTERSAFDAFGTTTGELVLSLGQERYESALATGRAMTLDEAVEYAMSAFDLPGGDHESAGDLSGK
jgi:predicted ATPase/class 3 adenylate cyclase